MRFHVVETVESPQTDYLEVFVFDNEGNVMRRYGDSYHDRGREKADGYTSCLMDLFKRARTYHDYVEVEPNNTYADPEKVWKVYSKKRKIQ